MARPIKDTPVLTGKNADRFIRAINANENRKVSAEEYSRACRVYNRVLRNIKSDQR